MIPQPFLYGIVSLISLSILFVALATCLCCLIAETYNKHKGRHERKGRLQKARNLIKNIPFGPVKDKRIQVTQRVNKCTQFSTFNEHETILLNDLHNSKKIQFSLETKYEDPDQISKAPVYAYSYGAKPLILAESEV